MGDSDVPELSSDSSESESLSWMANSMDWDYESDETNPEIIFISPMDSNDIVGLVGHDDEDTVSDAESAIWNMPVIEDQGVVPDDELVPQGRMSFGGIWWNSS